MGTPLMWYAFKKTFDFYDNLIFFPFQWNHTYKRVYFVPKNIVYTWFSNGILLFSYICYCANIKFLISENEDRKWTTSVYIQVLVSIIQAMFHFVILTFAVYFTLHGDQMAALFSDSYRALSGAVEVLKVPQFLPTPPFHRDILGIIFLLVMCIGPVFGACAVFPGISVFLKIDPLYRPFQHFRFSPITLVLAVFCRLLFATYDLMLLVRWFSFSIMQLFLVLTIGNTGLHLLYDITRHPKKYRHLPQKPASVRYVVDKLCMAIWQHFIIKLVIIQRRILLQTRFWSYNLGWNIFILITVGVTLWSVINYALIALTSIIPVELICFAICMETLISFVYGTLIPYVTSIESGSAKLNAAFKNALISHKLGRRYVKTLTTAKISTPFFIFRKKAIILLFRIPFEVTLNLVLTFPAKV